MNNLLGALDANGQVLKLHNRRLELLARNLANADTPQFKARDIDFRQVLRQAQAAGEAPLATTAAAHLPLDAGAPASGEYFRVPFNASFDGNTVELSVEQAQFGKAAADLQSSLAFLENRVNGLKKALRGE